MSFFKTCEDCEKEINSYVYIYCDECLKKHLVCQTCQNPISKMQDEISNGEQLCLQHMKNPNPTEVEYYCDECEVRTFQTLKDNTLKCDQCGTEESYIG